MANDKLTEEMIMAVEQTADHVMITDKSGRILFVNKAFKRTTGFSEREAVGKFPSILKSGFHKDDYYKKLWQTILKGQAFKSTTTNKTKQGKIYYADQTITPLKDKKGRITHFVSIWKDDTERIQNEDKMFKLAEKLEFEKRKFEKLVLLDGLIDGIHEMDELVGYILNTIGYILESRRCSLMLLDERTKKLSIKGAIGLDNEDIMKEKLSVGKGIAGLVAKKGKPLLVELIDTDKRLKRGNRTGYKTRSFLSVPLRLEHKILGVVNVTDKVSAAGEVFTPFDLEILLHIVRRSAVAISNVHMLRELKHLTITDYKTKLFNYRYFLSALEHECNRAKRTGEPLSLIMIDLDDFKAYNERYGHLQGDEFLRKFGIMLKEKLREVDISCRYGGDEFIVILTETDLRQARTVAKKLLKHALQLKLKRKVTFSIGVSQFAADDSVKGLVEKVDGALLAAKSSGKDKIHVGK